ncbi:hypothetical protein E4U43_006739 [Claviceps pusilla]|uniref:Uncharacterized protein n=1 Tax=Claviceps pusilla TaxID=123648 RepID=A0A9P7SSP2_9HYPO|nr:hypothetical protein E4U43_006739 [Claviceps pusilla]
MAPRHRPLPFFLLELLLLASTTTRGGSCAVQEPLPDRTSSPQECTVGENPLCAAELPLRNPDPGPPADPDPDPDPHADADAVSPQDGDGIPQQPLHRVHPGAAAPTVSSTDKSNPLEIPSYNPIVTPPPSQDAALATLGYKQMTYYTCNTIGAREHCGWHVPIVRAQGVRRDSGTVWIIVVCVAGVFALALV